MAAAPRFVRARTPANKEQRAQDLLSAARQLAIGGVRTLTLTAIANRAGIDVSGVRRYFGSREEILLTLAAEEWNTWAQDVLHRLGSTKATSSATIADLLSRSLADAPLFCDLLAHAALSLERETPLERVHAYKLTALAATGDVAAALHNAHPALDIERWRLVTSAVTAVGAMYWQYANPSHELAQLYQRSTDIAHATVEFEPRVATVARAVIDGLADPPW